MSASPIKKGIFLLCLMGWAGVWLLLYLLLSGCSTPGERPPVQAGQILYSAKCASCHRLLPPEDYTSDVWQEYVSKYGKQMAEAQRQEVLDYLQKNAKPSQ